MKKNKRGQFYLISALIIITVLLSFVTYRGYIAAPPIRYKIYDLGEELGIETAEVIDHGIYTGKDFGQIMSDWAEEFKDYSNLEDEQFVFVYVEGGVIKGRSYSQVDTGDISVQTAEDRGIRLPQTDTVLTDIRPQESVTLSLGDVNTTVTAEDLEEGGYYFVITGKGGEVATGSSGGGEEDEDDEDED